MRREGRAPIDFLGRGPSQDSLLWAMSVLEGLIRNMTKTALYSRKIHVAATRRLDYRGSKSGNEG